MRQIAVLDLPNQKLSIRAGGRRLTLSFWYSDYTDRWSMDVAVDGEPVVRGRRLVTGTDLLAPFGLGVGALFLFSEAGADPTRENLPLGVVKLYHATQEELDAAVAA